MASSPEIQEIKDKIDIADLIGEYLKLIPAGIGTYKTNCPFHNEKTPSMMVSPSRGSFHCFGCGTGGDIFEFLMKMENIEFAEALKILAQKAGVTLSRQNPEAHNKKNRLYDLCELTAKYWQRVLLESPRAQEAREYLSRRGLSDESIEKFKIGYAVEEWDNLFNFLIKRGYRPEEIFNAGLAIRKERGSGFYDRFRHRIMFPIIDQHGRIVGFGGRALKADEPAKYINSPQTDIYNKSEVLYGLYWAKDAIRKADQCILVEGYMDVIPSHQAGIKNVVSISGTALTEEQLTLMKRFTNNLSLSLDMDEAGQRAALRSIDLALQKEFNIKVISLPHGKDPGECAINNPEDWRQAILDAESVMEYFWARACKDRNLSDPQAKKEIAKFIGEKIANIGNPIEKDHWTHEIANRLNVREEALRELVGRFGATLKTPAKAPLASQKPASEAISKKAVIGVDLKIFRQILAIIWIYPNFLPKLPEILSPEVIFDLIGQSLYKDLILFYTKNNELFTLTAAERNEQNIFDPFYNMVVQQAADPQAVKILEQSYLLAQKDFFDLEAKDAKIELDNLIRLLKSNYLTRELSRLKNEMEQAEKRGDDQAYGDILKQHSELIKQKSAI